MPRYKITIEYDGTKFSGWQRQKDVSSVQQCLEKALFAFCQEDADIYGAGRTDTGVHALGQVAHFDISKEHDPQTIKKALNFHLKPHAIAILSAEAVNDEFHARFDAVERRYLYHIINRQSPLALDAFRAWQVWPELDTTSMQKAASYLVGKHDFTSFRSSQCQAKSPLKTVDEIHIEQTDEHIRIYLRARSFLHHMVRNIVGTLKLVGEGKWTPEDVGKALKTKDRSAAGPTCPPEGLYLTDVLY